MKRCSASLATREMLRMAIVNKSTNKCWRGCEEKATLVHCWWECRLVQPLWKTVWNCLRKLKMELPFDSAIPLLGLYPKSPETPMQKNLCTPKFIAAQSTIAKCQKQPRCPSQQISGPKSYGIFTQWNFMQQRERTVSYTHLTLPTTKALCRSRWSPYH